LKGVQWQRDKQDDQEIYGEMMSWRISEYRVWNTWRSWCQSGRAWHELVGKVENTQRVVGRKMKNPRCGLR